MGLEDLDVQQIAEMSAIVPPREVVIRLKYHEIGQLIASEKGKGICIKSVEFETIDGILNVESCCAMGAISGACVLTVAMLAESKRDAILASEIYESNKVAMMEHGSHFIKHRTIKKGL